MYAQKPDLLQIAVYKKNANNMLLPLSPNAHTSLSPHYRSHGTVSNSLSLFQDLIHSVASIVSIFKRLRRFVTVNPAEEKSLSEDVAMAGIDSISRAIFDKFGKSLRCFGSLHHLIAFSKSLWGGVRIYR